MAVAPAPIGFQQLEHASIVIDVIAGSFHVDRSCRQHRHRRLVTWEYRTADVQVAELAFQPNSGARALCTLHRPPLRGPYAGRARLMIVQRMSRASADRRSA